MLALVFMTSLRKMLPPLTFYLMIVFCYFNCIILTVIVSLFHFYYTLYNILVIVFV